MFVPPAAADILLDEVTQPDGQGSTLESVVVATANAAETHAAGDALARRRERVT